MTEPLAVLRRLFDEAVRAADPMRSLAAHLPPRPEGRAVVVGAGKASARMAEAVEAVWGPCEGLVITRYGYARPCAGVEIVEAAHPVPDAAGPLADLVAGAAGCSPFLKSLTESEGAWLTGAAEDPEAALAALHEALRETALLFVALNLVIDIAYVLIDPRIGFS